MNYLLFGEETYSIKNNLQRIIKEYVKEDNFMNVITYDARNVSIDMILDDANTIPFFSDNKVIVVENANFFSGSNDTHIDTKRLEDYLNEPMESTVLIFVGYFSKPDARKKILKLMKTKGKVLEFKKLDNYGKNNFIREQLQKNHVNITKDGETELISRLPSDLQTIHNELDKLFLYDDKITYEIVKKLISKPLEDNVFELANAVVSKNVKKAFEIWNDLNVLNTNPIQLIAVLASQFRFLYQVKELHQEGYSEKEITDILQAHPYRVKISLDTSYRLKLNDILSVLHSLAILDQNIKSGKVDKRLGFELFLMNIK